MDEIRQVDMKTTDEMARPEEAKQPGAGKKPDGAGKTDELKKPVALYIIILAAVTLAAVIAGTMIYAVPVVRNISNLVSGVHVHAPIEIEGIEEIKDLEFSFGDGTESLPGERSDAGDRDNTVDRDDAGDWDVGSCEFDQKEIRRIDLDVHLINLTVQSGDVLRVEWKCNGMLSPVIREENGVLKIRQNDVDGLRVKLGIGDDFDLEDLGANLILTVPEGYMLDEFDADVECGNLMISGVQSRNTEIGADFGSILLGNGSYGKTVIEADCGNVELVRLTAEKTALQADFGRISVLESSFDTLDASADCGQVLCTGITADGVVLEADMGSIDISGDFNALKAECSLGSISVLTDKPEEEVRLDLSADLGNVTVNGKARSRNTCD